MMASIAASEHSEVELIEQNEKLGKKLYLTGKGRCNITNAEPIENFFSKIPTNPKFLYHAFSEFDNNDLISFMNSHKLKTKIERGGRVFPLSDKSSDVIKALELALKECGVKINLNEKVLSIKNNGRFSIKTSLRNLCADRVVLASGGVSYPSTGSSGDGYKFLRELGVEIVKPRVGLAPILLKDSWVGELSGITLKNVKLTVREVQKTKPIFSEMGELLFTHTGISGPLVLKASSLIRGECLLTLDLKPAIETDELENRLIEDLSLNKNQNIENALERLTVRRLLPVIIELSGISKTKKANQVSKEERKALVSYIKKMPLNFKELAGFNEAIITSGGVSVKEINPKTMELKKIPGLYVAGEIIDVDAFTGGYNLQIAFSTGYTAGAGIGGENENNKRCD